MEICDAQKECSMKGPIKHGYLGDGSGEPDPEIQRLETALAKFRHRGEAPDFSRLSAPATAKKFWVLPVFGAKAPRFAVAAVCLAVLATVVCGFFYLLLQRQRPDTSVRWDVAQFAGAPRVGSKAVGEHGKVAGLRAGETLETDAQSQATITAATFGEINIEPNTPLGVPRARPSRGGFWPQRGAR